MSEATATVEVERRTRVRVWSVAAVALLDATCGVLALAFAGLYLGVRFLNGQVFADAPQGFLVRTLILFYGQVLSLISPVGPLMLNPGALMAFSNRWFADRYLVGMILVHLGIAAIFFALRLALIRNALARFVHIVPAVVAMVLIGSAALTISETTDATTLLALMAATGLIPAWVILTMILAPSPTAQPGLRPGRSRFRILYVTIFLAFGLVAFTIALWASLPIAIVLKRL